VRLQAAADHPGALPASREIVPPIAAIATRPSASVALSVGCAAATCGARALEESPPCEAAAPRRAWHIRFDRRFADTENDEARRRG